MVSMATTGAKDRELINQLYLLVKDHKVSNSISESCFKTLTLLLTTTVPNPHSLSKRN